MKSSHDPSTADAIDAEFSRVAIDQLARLVAWDDSVLDARTLLDRVEGARGTDDESVNVADIMRETNNFYDFARFLDVAESSDYIRLDSWLELERFRSLAREVNDAITIRGGARSLVWLHEFAERMGRRRERPIGTRKFHGFRAYLQLQRSMRASDTCESFAFGDWFITGSGSWEIAANFLMSPRHFAQALAAQETEEGRYLRGGLDYLSHVVRFNEVLKHFDGNESEVNQLILITEWAHMAPMCLQKLQVWAQETASWAHGLSTLFVGVDWQSLRPTFDDLKRLEIAQFYDDPQYIETRKQSLSEAVESKRILLRQEDDEAEVEWLKALFADASPELRLYISRRLSELEGAQAGQSTRSRNIPLLPWERE